MVLICSETTRKIISDACQTPEDESCTLLLAASILRKAILKHNDSFSFKGSFPSGCEKSAVPTQLRYFFRQLLAGPKSSPTKEHSRKVLSVSEMAMLDMTSANLRCEPPLAVFLGLKVQFQTRNKKLVQLFHENCLSVSYKSILTTEASFAQAIAEQTKANSDNCLP